MKTGPFQAIVFHHSDGMKVLVEEAGNELIDDDRDNSVISHFESDVPNT
jgi:hypothetical protein